MTVYIVMESWAGEPHDIVRVYSSLEAAREEVNKLIKIDVDEYYHYIIETYEVY